MLRVLTVSQSTGVYCVPRNMTDAVMAIDMTWNDIDQGNPTSAYRQQSTHFRITSDSERL